MADELTLKWGTLKAYDFTENLEAQEILKKYFAEGRSMSAMMQRDTGSQKEILCQLIDVCNGEIWNDWEGEIMTKDEAKKYVMDYGK